VKYDVDGSGNVLANSVTLTGTGTGAVKSHVVAGSIWPAAATPSPATSCSARSSTIANYFGGTTAYNGTTNVDRADVQHFQHRHRWHLHQRRLQQRHRRLHCRRWLAEGPQPAHPPTVAVAVPTWR
jgi:hypothetical protein